MKDRFSLNARQYAAFRPRYPEELFDFLFRNVAAFDTAWDAGTGNGQAAEVLATRFRQVYATDVSQNQLDQAIRRPNITYIKSGERVALSDQSVDLVTVAQAIHWFDRKVFYEEVRRVLRPRGVIAIWVYGLLKISPQMDPLIEEFYTTVVGPYWDPERRLIDEQLRTIEFPFEEIKTPSFIMSFRWSLDELEGYLNTWSATQRYIGANGVNPVPGLMQKIRRMQAEEPVAVRFPLYLRAGR